jgi:retinol dehydrogenase 12
MITISNSNKTSAQRQRVFLVTGATGAIGKAIARKLAVNQDSEIVLVCRDRLKAEQAVDEIIQSTQNTSVRFELADLSIYTDIRNLAKCWEGPLHVLINNAACTPRTRQETAEGVELQFATNVLGYFWLINEFTSILRNSTPARVVNVASYWAGGLNLDDLEFKCRTYDNDLAYRQSKQADRMISAAFAEKLKSYNIAVNACHPGDVNSTLSNNLGFGGHETPAQGAATPVWLATHPTGQDSTGKYFEHMHESSCAFSSDKQAVNALFDVCSRYANKNHCL